jgi:hypothetical protein
MVGRRGKRLLLRVLRVEPSSLHHYRAAKNGGSANEKKTSAIRKQMGLTHKHLDAYSRL